MCAPRTMHNTMVVECQKSIIPITWFHESIFSIQLTCVHKKEMVVWYMHMYYELYACVNIMHAFWLATHWTPTSTHMRLRANTRERMPLQKNQLAQAFKYQIRSSKEHVLENARVVHVPLSVIPSRPSCLSPSFLSLSPLPPINPSSLPLWLSLYVYSCPCLSFYNVSHSLCWEWILC